MVAFLPLIWFKMSGSMRRHCPRRSGCYATQHGLLDADGALCKVGVAPGHLLLDVPEIHQLELPLEVSTRWTAPPGLGTPSSPRWCSAATFLVRLSCLPALCGILVDGLGFVCGRQPCFLWVRPRWACLSGFHLLQPALEALAHPALVRCK